MRIGIDVGGTNTDAVLMDERRVLAEVKTPTTPDVTSGIVAALKTLIADSGVEAVDVQGDDDRDDALHERCRRGQAPHADGVHPTWFAGDPGAAADGRLARFPLVGIRRPS